MRPGNLARKLGRFLIKRSNGVRVSRRVSGLIHAADRARDRGDWDVAVQLFADVLRRAPRLGHVHVQHGHALKERGELADAYRAYAAAAALAPGRRDPRLHLGHAAKLLGAFEQAARHYLALLVADPTDAEAAGEFSQVIGRIDDAARDQLLDELRRALPAGLHQELVAPVSSGAVLVFDISDLVGFFAHARRPTGIQRVQLETVMAALAEPPAAGPRLAIACMPAGVDEWRELPATLFARLARLSADTEREEGAWQRACSQLNLALLLGTSLRFEPGSCLVNLGASWSLGNYFLALRHARAGHGLRYLPFIHDLIPFVHPDYHQPALVAEFSAWLVGALAHADHLLTNSSATAADLHRVGRELGFADLAERTSVVPLDVHAARPASAVAGAELPVPTEPYVLFVGTIEPRKGHAVAFDAWSTLLAAGERVPLLLCVSGNGWGNDAVFARLRADARLARRVTILAQVDEAALDRLYRGALFTIYPSRYEGWGLPVTEALARGRIVVTTTASSLPEAGGEFACYVPPGDADALAAAVSALLADPAGRTRLEQRIARGFRPRTWTDLAGQVVARAVAVAAAPGTDAAPASAVAGRYYDLGRAAAPASSGERMRVGTGWFWPVQWGNRVRLRSGRLAFSVVAPGGPRPTRYVLALLLRGLDDAECPFSIAVGDRVAATGRLAAAERRWVLMRHLGVSSHVELRLGGAAEAASVRLVTDAAVPFASEHTVGLEGLVVIPAGGIGAARPLLASRLSPERTRTA